MAGTNATQLVDMDEEGRMLGKFDVSTDDTLEEEQSNPGFRSKEPFGRGVYELLPNESSETSADKIDRYHLRLATKKLKLLGEQAKKSASEKVRQFLKFVQFEVRADPLHRPSGQHRLWRRHAPSSQAQVARTP